ncbi:DUF3667 domain-containing protein [Winogradskyella pulchriflava]|uniref:DUF3667 domain-containing protein n=1 Tax=Winogradskyella pulchriflava TaxID=1110688 RepID=A0ABV6Q5S5_9FLAO
METQNCHNCQHSFEGNFCNHCGQRNIGNNRLRIREVVNDFFDNTFNLHKGFFFTFWKLIVSPGKVAHAYIKGQRKRFTNPTRYLVIALAFQAFMDYWFKTDEILEKDEYFYFPFLSERLNNSMELWNIKLTIEFSLLSSLFEVLLFPIIFYVLFRSLKLNFTELLTTNFYYISTSTLITMTILFVTKVLFDVFVSIEFIALLLLIYVSWAYLSFFKTTPLWIRSLKIGVGIAFFLIMRVFVLPFTLSLLNPLT